MSEYLSGPGQVETHADGSKTFTHAQRFPDNSKVVTQEYDAAGHLVSAKIRWTGFAGDVLNVTVTFDQSGKVQKEEGFRAEGVTNPVSEFMKPLPQGVAPTPTQTETSPVVVPPLGQAGVEKSVPDQKAAAPVTTPAPTPNAPAAPAAQVSAAPHQSDPIKSDAPATPPSPAASASPTTETTERRATWDDDEEDGSDN